MDSIRHFGRVVKTGGAGPKSESSSVILGGITLSGKMSAEALLRLIGEGESGGHFR
jgi:hypothetical protein